MATVTNSNMGTATNAAVASIAIPSREQLQGRFNSF